MEDFSSQAALLCALIEEVPAVSPIDVAQLSETVFSAWRAGDSNLEMILQSAIHEKDPKFKAADIPLFANELNKHASAATARVNAGPSIGAGPLEQEQFDLFLKMADYDLQAHHVYIVARAETACKAFFQQSKYTADRYATILASVRRLFDPASHTAKMILLKHQAKTPLTIDRVLGLVL